MRYSPLLAAIVIAAAGGVAAAQSSRLDYPTGTVSSVPPAAGAPTWSGQGDASGDPRMTADANRAAAANFHQCLERLWPLAARRHVSRATFVRYTKMLRPDLQIDRLDVRTRWRTFWYKQEDADL